MYGHKLPEFLQADVEYCDAKSCLKQMSLNFKVRALIKVRKSQWFS